MYYNRPVIVRVNEVITDMTRNTVSCVTEPHVYQFVKHFFDSEIMLYTWRQTGMVVATQMEYSMENLKLERTRKNE